MRARLLPFPVSANLAFLQGPSAHSAQLVCALTAYVIRIPRFGRMRSTPQMFFRSFTDIAIYGMVTRSYSLSELTKLSACTPFLIYSDTICDYLLAQQF
jgi:hypothetical protein